MNYKNKRENDRKREVECAAFVEQEEPRISKVAALRRVKNWKAVFPDDVSVEVWNFLREKGVAF